MKSVRYAIYLCITLHFLRRCLRKSLTQVKHPTISRSGNIGGRDSLPESLRPAADELVNEIDREILQKMAKEARHKRSHGFQIVDTMVNLIRDGRMVKDINQRLEDSIEVRSVSASRRGDETQLNVDCVLSRPVEYVDMTVQLCKPSVTPYT